MPAAARRAFPIAMPKTMKILSLIVLSLLSVGCTRLTVENYNKIAMGMPYDEVVQAIGKPDRCDDLMGLRNCVWGDESHSIQVSFAGGKAMLFSSKNLK